MAERNERNFSSEQIRRNRDAVIGLQAGTNIGATQVPPVCCQTLLLIYSASRPVWEPWGTAGTCKVVSVSVQLKHGVLKILFMERKVAMQFSISLLPSQFFVQ